MKVKIKKQHPDAVIPKYQTKGAAGFDLCVLEDHLILPGETKLINTGLSFEIPEGYEMQVIPRSGVSLKTKLRISNSPGCIDSDYRGIVGLIVDNIGNTTLEIKAKDRIAQGKITPVIQAEFIEVDELEETQRGSGGFGSTDNK